MTARRPRVVIVQERLPHYRVPFFEQLRARLAADGVDLALVHGHGHSAMATRADEVELPWARVVDNRVVKAGRTSLVWQPVVRMTASADLVIVEQATRMAANYALLARQTRGGPRVAFWGHGANLQSDGSWGNRASEAAKARVSRLPHWWFAYTEDSARRVEALGFRANRVTVVQNAIDTSLIEAAAGERDPYRCIFVGSLYQGKRLDLLFEAAALFAVREPRFRLTVIGDGKLRGYVEAEAARRPYVEYLESSFGKDLGVELKASSAMLLPGAVGLSVLDAFAAGLPVVTTWGKGHGPELEYVRHGENGLVVSPVATDYADSIANALEPQTTVRLRRGCATTALRITLDEMTRRFCDGIHAALRTRGRDDA